jgi:mRNA-degrading endonuclease YafQ of YafQ-DinJ toxin-antitoxin module
VPYDFDLAPRFKKAYGKKSKDRQEQVERTMRLLVVDPSYPGLRTHRIRGAHGVWECYIDSALRITFEYASGDTIIFRNNCEHDSVLRRP